MAVSKIDMAIVGATGLVGSELIEALIYKNFPAGEVRLFASWNTAGEKIDFMDDDIQVKPISADFHEGVGIVFMAAHPMVSRDLSEQAAKAGAVVIDASRAFRMDKKVPLVVPDINGDTLGNIAESGGIIASPSPQAVAVSLVAAPLDRNWGVERIISTAIHGTTAAGRSGFEEHQRQTIDIFNQAEVKMEKFTRQSAFNIFPRVGDFEADDTIAERELMEEVPRVLGKKLRIAGTSVQAPYFCGVGLSLNIELGAHAEPVEIRSALSEAAGVSVLDDPDQEIYPDTLAAMARDEVLVGRVRPDPSNPNTVQLWVSMDNLRKGAALNMVQIAEIIASKID